MDEKQLNSRLSLISTIWTMVGDAARPSASGTSDMRMALIQRYQGAAYRYLLGAVRNPETADELFQEFALRVMKGAFSRADPARGRFRDYLKTALIHLVLDHQIRQRSSLRQLNLEVAEPATTDEPCTADEHFLRSWREDLLARTWSALESDQRERGHPYYSVLRLRVDFPDLSSAQMAERLNEELRPESPFSEVGIRKTLQRARERFADRLLEEVAYSLDNPAYDQLEQELIDLELLSYCRPALQRRRGQNP
jgi:RNA polymerase sigma factor (sigma-70 family)